MPYKNNYILKPKISNILLDKMRINLIYLGAVWGSLCFKLWKMLRVYVGIHFHMISLFVLVLLLYIKNFLCGIMLIIFQNNKCALEGLH